MRVKVIRTKADKPPASIAETLPETQTFISAGKEYEVSAMAVFQSTIYLQIVDDLPMINWYPAWFFEVSNPSVPNDWICTLLTGELQMILGPDFVATDEASYNRMVELDSESVAAFWRRFDANAQAGESPNDAPG